MENQTQQEVILKVSLDNSEALAGVNELDTKLNEVGSKSVAETTFKSLKAQLKDANDEATKLATKFGANSTEFLTAAKNVATLKDKFNDYTKTVEAFNPDNKLQSLVSIAQGATGAIQGVTGAMAFLGVESDSANETIVKLQGLLNFSQALNSVDDIKNGFKNLGSVLGLTTKAEEGASIASKGLGLALKGLGIGLIVSAIAYLVTNWDNLKDSVTKLIPGLNNAGDTFNKVKAIVLGVGNVVLQYAITPIKTLISLIQGDFKGAIADVKKGLDVKGNFNSGYGGEVARQQEEEARKQLQVQIDNNQKTLDVLKAGGKNTTDLERKIYQDKVKVTKDGSEEQKNAQHDLAVFEAGVNKQKLDAQKQYNDKAQQLREAAATKRKQELEQQKADAAAALKSQQELIDELQLEIEKNGKTDRQKELIDLREWYEEKKKIAADNFEALKLLKEDYGNKLAVLTAKYDAQDIEDAKAAAEEKKKVEDDIQQEQIDRLNKLTNNFAVSLQKQVDDEKAAADAKIENEKRVKNNREELLTQTATTLNTFSNVLGKQTAVGKGIAVASATIDTYKAANSALKADYGVFGPAAQIARFASVAATIAVGIKNIKTIVSTKVPGGSDGSGSVPSVSLPTAPTLSSTQVNQPVTPQDVRVVNQQSASVKAYIVQKDLDNNEAKQNFLNSLSTF